MGTRFELVLPGEDAVRLRAAGEEALETIAEEERRLSLFRTDSLVSLLNREAGGAAVRVDDEFLDLLEICQRVHVESGGAFDPTVGAWMARRGFGENRPDRGKAGAVPPDLDRVRIDRTSRTAALPAGMQLDLGAVGKGWAIDQAGRVLREAGVEDALLHGGTSTVLALGAEPGCHAWKVRVEEETVLLRNASLSVSRWDGRMAEREGHSQGHVLDPREPGAPPAAALAAVVCASAALADAWSTALLVLGTPPPGAPLRWSRVAGVPAAGGAPAPLPPPQPA